MPLSIISIERKRKTEAIKNNLRITLLSDLAKTKEFNKALARIFNKGFVPISIIMFIILFAGTLNAQKKDSLSILETNSSQKLFSNSFNFCPFSAFFGLYSGNYERLIDQTHGIVLRFDYESISDKYNNNPVELSGYGFIVNYRYHFAKAMESIFIGSYIRYRIYDGTGTADATNFDFKIKEWI